MTTSTVSEVPRLQQPQAVAHDNAIHYGYCAFKDISLASSAGIDHRVQPAHSPYYRLIPSRELIPFVPMTFQEVDESLAGAEAFTHTVQPFVTRPKSARECIDEMVDSYGGWGFVKLSPLTGLDEADANLVFRTIQPFKYLLKDLQNEVDFGAVERIANTESYEVTYNGETVTLQPLPDNLKVIAENVRNIMANGIAISLGEADEVKQKTTLSMTSAFSGGDGKRRADPHDQYIFSQLGETVPQLLTTTGQTQAPTVTVNDDLRREELEVQKEMLRLKRIELGLEVPPVVEPPVVAPPVVEPPSPEAKLKRGDKVDVGGVEATVTDTRFGRIKAELPDGTEVTL